jgi:hypothetical protein
MNNGGRVRPPYEAQMIMAKDFLRRIGPLIFVTEPDPLKGVFPSRQMYGYLAIRGIAICLAQAGMEFAVYAGRVKEWWPAAVFHSDFVLFGIPGLLSVIACRWAARRMCHPIAALAMGLLLAMIGMTLGMMVGGGMYGE